nr:hypothetical protein [Tanacetum cinerariifolium]
MPKILSLAWKTILEIKLSFEDKHCHPEDILELFQKLHNDVQNIYVELAVCINTLSWDRPIICYDDDDENCTIASTPILSTKEPDNSLSIGDEHLDTIKVTKSDEFIKSSVENLVPIPSESEGIPDNMCDVHFHDNSLPLNASPLDSELVSSEVLEIVIPEVGGIHDDILLTIKDDILQEKLLNINLIIANIEALKDNPTPSSDFMSKSSSTSINFLLEKTIIFDNSLPESKTFCFDLEEISSGKYDCFCFKNEHNLGEFTMDEVEDTFLTREPRVHNALPTHPTLQLNLDFILSSESLFAYVKKLLQEEQWAYLSTHPLKRLTSLCFDDDDDEDYTSAITPGEPVLSTEEPDNSLSMGDEHLDTIPATESDEFIKSGVENLIPIP